MELNPNSHNASQLSPAPLPNPIKKENNLSEFTATLPKSSPELSGLPPELLGEIFSKFNNGTDSKSTSIVSKQFNATAIDQTKRDMANEIGEAKKQLSNHLGSMSSENETKIKNVKSDINNLREVQNKIKNNVPVALAFASLNENNASHFESPKYLPRGKSLQGNISENEAKDMIDKLLGNLKQELRSTQSNLDNLVEVRQNLEELDHSPVFNSVSLLEIGNSSKNISHEIVLKIDHLNEDNIEELHKSIKKENSPGLVEIAQSQKELAIRREINDGISHVEVNNNCPGTSPSNCTAADALLVYNKIRIAILYKYYENGDYEKALIVAKKMPEDTQNNRAEALKDISSKLMVNGKIEEAKKFKDLLPHKEKEISETSDLTSSKNVTVAIPETNDPNNPSKRVWVEIAEMYDPSLTDTASTNKILLEMDQCYTDARKIIHDKIKAEIIGDAKPVHLDQKPVAMIVIGPPGSGKTTTIRAMENKNEFVEISMDNVADRIPEYQRAINLGNDGEGAIITAKDAYIIVQDEAKDLVFDLVFEVTESRKNMIYDGTGASIGLYTKLMFKLQEDGYDVQLMFFDTDLKDNIQRTESRADENGRFIDRSTISDLYKSCRANFQTLSTLADSATIMDNRGSSPVVKGRYVAGDIIEGQDYIANRKF